MEKKPYHHGDLRHALIEAGIDVLHASGEEGFSLRRVAAKCGVSHNAPYKHFADKEAMMGAMKNYVMELLSAYMREVYGIFLGDIVCLCKVGRSYVDFFAANPSYYHFLYNHFTFDLSFAPGSENMYQSEPFLIFSRVAQRNLTEWGVAPENFSSNITTMWAAIHGLAGLAVAPGITTDKDWGEMTEEVLTRRILIN